MPGFQYLGWLVILSQLQTDCTHEEASGRHFHFSEAPTSLLEVIFNKLPPDGATVQANFLTKIGWPPF